MGKRIGECLVCERALNGFAEPFAEFWKFFCPACGPYLATRECCDDYDGHAEFLRKPRSQVVIGHWLRRASATGKNAILTMKTALYLVQEDWLPSHLDQANNLIRAIGDKAPLGVPVVVDDLSIQLSIGAETLSGVLFLADELLEQGMCRRFRKVEAILTLKGWTAYNELKRGQATGTKAFMAMPFGKPDLDDTFLPIARSAAKSCGFHLERLDDQPRPGIIDVRMRVAIKEARFAIVDLTYANLGAYWEAGFAEGLGKPVIYTVRADHDEKVHFDTAHLTRVIWYADKLDVAQADIAAMIRNELPDAVHEG